MTTGIQADPAPNLSSATYQSEDDDPRTSDESEPELEYGSSSDDGSATFHGPQILASTYRHSLPGDSQSLAALPAELKSIILKQLSVKDLKKVAEAAPHLAHEELRLRVKTLSIRAHLRISTSVTQGYHPRRMVNFELPGTLGQVSVGTILGFLSFSFSFPCPEIAQRLLHIRGLFLSGFLFSGHWDRNRRGEKEHSLVSGVFDGIKFP
ncbi:hypothetical protein BKA70DRAFT_1222269 [Coprinopsis sp. MPI-PUGE-AT-0042]|nr:hypothetical protein BKA70DRAFT_1222269 [Coprinopsis sp. MPI-PUGE-AT-0042]